VALFLPIHSTASASRALDFHRKPVRDVEEWWSFDHSSASSKDHSFRRFHFVLVFRVPTRNRSEAEGPREARSDQGA
jgi:hypothetical protein